MKHFDANGMLMADVPGSGVSRKDSNAKSGNPNHDTRSGKFGGGGNQPRNATPPANTSQLDYHRMLDAVREAARSIDEPNEDTISEFIHGRASSPDQVDVAQFLALVTQQRKQDLVDVLDQQLRGAKYKVRMTASRVYMRRIMRTLEPQDAQEVIHRLEAMGHDAKKVAKLFPNVSEGTAASDDGVFGIAPALEFSADFEFDVEDKPDPMLVLAESIKSLQLPTPEVTVNLPSGKKVVTRDTKTGLISSVEDA